MNLAGEPFVVLYALLPFIFRKDLGASLLQLSILTALRPVLPLLSFYWSANLTRRPDRLRANLMVAWALGRIPFLLVFWWRDAWYLIGCCVFYEFFNKSGIPALIEILKINMPKELREKTYTAYFVLSFCESVLLGLLMMQVLDRAPAAWAPLCGVAALISLSSLWMQLRIPMPPFVQPAGQEKLPFFQKVMRPWMEAYQLMQRREDFARFQWSFMIGGFGLMLIAPSLAVFYVDYLHVDHAEMVTGRSILMGLGIILSSMIWRKWLSTMAVNQLTSRILVGFGLFPLALLVGLWNFSGFYLAFIVYGIAQAGSHLVWNLSGTLFAHKEDSAQYSRVNILMAGLRGLVAPSLGGVLCAWVGPLPVLCLGTCICIGGALYNSRVARVRVSL